ncbi:hypothetical protein FRB99_004494 [Tulasnella sp. 403]|nr:hypothetical protein FRB99_004494 [Tulasnella sp. 403]
MESDPHPLPKLPISLEPIYKDDEGIPIPKVRDIRQDLTHVYEPPHNPATKLRENLSKIMNERGGLENITIQGILNNPTDVSKGTPPTTSEAKGEPEEDAPPKSFTTDDLAEMRTQITNMLILAGNEAAGSIDLVDMLLTAPDPNWVPTRDRFTPGTLTASTVVNGSSALPAALPSVRALNAQVVVGTKDRTLRKASDIFQAAAERTARVVERGEQYWETAVRLRRSNWPLVTAPLRSGTEGPPSRTFQTSDNYAKDFRIAYGLEYSLPRIRKDALATIKDQATESQSSLIELKGPSKRLRVGMVTKAPDGTLSTGYMEMPSRTKYKDSSSSKFAILDKELSWAQSASMESELYEEVLREAANLPSTSARVTEKKISVDAAIDSVLTFELLELPESEDEKSANTNTLSSNEARNSCVAQLVYNLLIILLIRRHRANARAQTQRSEFLAAGLPPNVNHHLIAATITPILGPVISLLQFDSFILRIRRVFDDISKHMRSAGIPCEIEINPVGDDIKDVLYKGALFSETDSAKPHMSTAMDVRPTLESSMMALLNERDDLLKVNGEATLRLANRHTIRFTFTSPAILTLHLPQATINIFDEAQLNRFLVAELSRSVLERLREVGTEAEASLRIEDRTQWLVDGLEGTLVGDKGDRRLQMKVVFDKSFALTAVAVKTMAKGASHALTEKETLRYPPPNVVLDANERHNLSLEDWVKQLL